MTVDFLVVDSIEKAANIGVYLTVAAIVIFAINAVAKDRYEDKIRRQKY